MAKTITKLLGQYQRLSAKDLKAEWKRRWGEDPPLGRREELFRRLAYRIQEEAEGGLTPQVLAVIRNEIADSSEVSFQENSRNGMSVGTVIERRHKGNLFRVEVIEAGFRFNEKIYRTLTAIATEITGSQRNGPRFFGMR